MSLSHSPVDSHSPRETCARKTIPGKDVGTRSSRGRCLANETLPDLHRKQWRRWRTVRVPIGEYRFSLECVRFRAIGRCRVASWSTERRRMKFLRFVPCQQARSSRETLHAPYFAREREQRLAVFLGECGAEPAPDIPASSISISLVREFHGNSCPRNQRSCPRCYSRRPRQESSPK